MRSIRSLCFVVALLVVSGGVTTAHPHGDGNRGVTVMTRNLYLGADLTPVLAAQDFVSVLLAVDAVWEAVQDTDFRRRAVRLADEIVEAEPDLVGLQEAAIWRIQSPGDLLSGGTVPATEVAYDFVAILLAELASRGEEYEVVVSIDELDAELPSISGDDVRLTDRDVILARRARPANGCLQVLGTDAGHFDTLLQLPVGGVGGPVVTVFRGWVAADVRIRGREFRFLNAHLEDVIAAPIQEAQAVELLAGPAAVHRPVVCVGDFNSDAFGAGTDSYEILLAGGFEDAWTGVDGATWGHAADLRNALPVLTERLDLVLYRGRYEVIRADTVGDELEDRTDEGLWPSDHAGVVVELSVRCPRG